MDRLTERGYDYSNHYSKKFVSDCAVKLQQYEDEEEDGKLLHLPCKPGDTVYVAYSRDMYVLPYEVHPKVLESVSEIVKHMEAGRFGTRVFLTPEAAAEGVAKINKEIPYMRELTEDEKNECI